MRTAVCVALALAWTAVAPRAEAVSTLGLDVQCTPAGVEIRLDYDEDPDPPPGPPEWVGYDIVREGCAHARVVVNAEPLPRSGGDDHFVLLDVPPGPDVFKYVAVKVDSSRTPVYLYSPSCAGCWAMDYINCPTASVPAVHGFIVDDWGWALLIEPCPGSCGPTVYVQEPYASLLRPYHVPGESLRIFGEILCGSVEGCWVNPTHWSPAPCAVSSRRSTWGALKTRYR